LIRPFNLNIDGFAIKAEPRNMLWERVEAPIYQRDDWLLLPIQLK
jgi:hypothetical protein